MIKIDNLKPYQFPLLAAILLHLVLFLLIFTYSHDASSNLKSTSASTPIELPKGPSIPPIKSVSVNAKAVEAEIEKIKLKAQKEADFKQAEQRKLKQLQQNYKKTQLAQEKLKREMQKNKALAEKQKRLALAEKKKAEKAKQDLAQLKKKQNAEAEKLKKKQNELAELKKKRAAEEAAALKAKKEAEAKKLAELEPPTSPSSEKKKADSPSSNEGDSIPSSEIDRYVLLIKESIEKQWIIPDNTDANMSCELNIRVAPGGAVLNVKLARSSGNSALDESAKTAVMQASPLPVPTDPKLFKTFRELNLTVRPEV